MAQMEKLESLVGSALGALGLELVGIEFLAQGRHSLLRVYIDSEAGISVDDCARASHQISALLDVEDPIKGQYTLEVSSPGLERPLFKAAHYERFVGEEVQLRLKVPRDGRRKFKGKLLGIRDDSVVIEMGGEELVFPLMDVERGNLVPQW